MGSLYEEIRRENDAHAKHQRGSAFRRKVAKVKKNLTDQEQKAYQNFLASEDGARYLSWEEKAHTYLDRLDFIQQEFLLAQATDLKEIRSQLGKFSGALNHKGKPALAKNQTLIWSLIILLPLIISLGVGFLLTSLRHGNEVSLTMELIKYFALGIPVALLAGIIYKISRPQLMVKAAKKSLIGTGLSAKEAANTLNYHRNLYGFYFVDGDAEALTEKEFVEKVYTGKLTYEPDAKYFYDRAENLPGAIETFIAESPRQLPREFPDFVAPKAGSTRQYPAQSKAAQFIKDYQKNLSLQADLAQF